MNFIVETDLGHDPDDFFALCHLITAGHRVVALSLCPGSPSQVRIAAFLRERTGQEFRIGVAKPDAREEDTGVHRRLLDRFGFGEETPPDGESAEVLSQAHAAHPEAHFLIIGPAKGVGKFLAGQKLGPLTMQGGFLPYSRHAPAVRLQAFEGKESMPTFNFNGDRKAVDAILAADFQGRRFVGKNVCHTVVFDHLALQRLASARDAASEMYSTCMAMYLEQHGEKKFHDPTALVCHLHPEVGTWYAGRPARLADGWTTRPGEDSVLADVDRERLWHHLLGWT